MKTRRVVGHRSQPLPSCFLSRRVLLPRDHLATCFRRRQRLAEEAQPAPLQRKLATRSRKSRHSQGCQGERALSRRLLETVGFRHSAERMTSLNPSFCFSSAGKYDPSDIESSLGRPWSRAICPAGCNAIQKAGGKAQQDHRQSVQKEWRDLLKVAETNTILPALCPVAAPQLMFASRP